MTAKFKNRSKRVARLRGFLNRGDFLKRIDRRFFRSPNFFRRLYRRFFCALSRLFFGTPKKKKILLCRPLAGFNDMLVQIEKCVIYAQNHDRDLWIDTARRYSFFDCFSHYFAPSREFYFGFPIRKICDDASVFPRYLRYRLRETPPAIRNHDLRQYVDFVTGIPTTFDFDADYDETVLVHEQSGDGNGIEALARLQLLPALAETIKKTVQNFGAYDAIHIRNTDLKTDYQKFFADINDKLKGKIVLCTDDFRCQRDARKFWGERLLITRTLPEGKPGQSIHHHKSKNQYQKNVAMLTDLIVLASAKNLYIPFNDEAGGIRYIDSAKKNISGFSDLARALHQKPEIIRRLLGEEKSPNRKMVEN